MPSNNGLKCETDTLKDSVTALLPGLVKALALPEALRAGIIPWASPIPVFGDPTRARVATLGINPSSREFVDEAGCELEGTLRRFHTLRSLGLARWQDVEPSHLQAITQYCLDYFYRSPYDAWFKKLDYIVSGAGATYYGFASSACHLDLVPFATGRKWGELKADQRSALLGMSGDSLGVLLLPRARVPGVIGSAKWGIASSVAGVRLGCDVLVLGFNHNLQSSFGVTRVVMKAIREWVAEVGGTSRWEHS